MEVLLSAVLGDLVSRSISFLVDKYYQQKMGMGVDLQCLRRLLLQIEATVLEAEGRHITNRAMLQQLQMLREGMYKGHYMVDTIKNGVLQHEMVNDEGYPHINRQPYSQHLILEKCMFGRQAEIERITNFLLRESLGAESLGVLPIIGPARVGKSTLVEHICYDERVRSFFSSIVFCSGSDIGSKSFADLRDSGIVKHQSCVAHERSLIIIEFIDDGDVDEKNWIRLYSSRSCIPHGSKIIITSRSERFRNVGTTQPLELSLLPQEAHWYFFKVLAFGSTNPVEHPFLESAAMEMAAEYRCFVAANFVASLFRANFCTQFWRLFLRCHRNIVEKHVILFGEHPYTLLQKNHDIYLVENFRDPKFILVNGYKTCLRNDDPKVMLHEVHTGTSKAHGKFEVLVWRSRIPPYHEFVMSCEAQAQQHTIFKRKRELGKQLSSTLGAREASLSPPADVDAQRINAPPGLLRGELRISLFLSWANPDAHYWTLILKNMREYTRKHRAMFGKHPHDLLRNNHPVYLWRLAESSKIFLCHGFYTACPAKQEIPRVTFQEVLSGRVTPHGRFEVLAWTSQIPPCRSYLMSCSLDTPHGPHRVLDRKKRLRQLVT
uniref:Disease resistance N-terminal domain-containing protein n=1 Tax=Oryza meridionalis TaxID=40149 RepID=A0A0E0C7A5_9ORYZ